MHWKSYFVIRSDLMEPILIFFPDGTQINFKKEKLVQRSSKKFLEVSKNEAWKFQLLPNWLDNVSYWYTREDKETLPSRYYYYDRGKIIRVDFGVNMRSQFYGLHYAIVLNKKDNNHKKTFTVVPLTSKNKSGRFYLGKEIFNQTTNILNQQSIELKQKTDHILQELKDIILNGIDNNKKDIVKKEFIKFDKGIVTDTLNNIIISGKYNQNEVKQLKDEVYNNNKEIDSLSKVISIYSRYNKDTYVRLSDITTISKLRIRRINKYDPSGRIKLNSQQMALISDKLMDLYINK